MTMSTMSERLVARTMDKQGGHDIVAMNAGETFENVKWRVHRYHDSVEVTNLENAGRKGKTCTVFHLFGLDPIRADSTSDEFLMLAKRNADEARMRTAYQEAMATGWRGSDRQLRGVDVKPGGFKPLRVNGIHVTVRADYDSYSIEDIADEDQNGTQCMAKGKRSVGQFYRWVKDNAQKIQTMTMHDIMEELKSQGIQFHQFCSID